MGINLKPNDNNFNEIANQEIFVDKTMMIGVLNRIMKSPSKYACFSRPRRFGKTIAGDMLSAYFSKGADSRGLFAPYKISKDACFESSLNALNVMKIDMNSEFQNERNKGEVPDKLQDRIVAEFAVQFPDIAFGGRVSVGNCILAACARKGERFAVPA